MKLAIDLGTTHCLCAIWKNDEVVCVPNIFGEYKTPSIIHVDDNEEVVVGKIAKERRVSEPRNTVELFKRTMGKTKKYKVNKREYNSMELSALMIRQMIDDAEKYTECKVTEVVVSVPAYFTDAQRIETRNSALLCGVKAERIINEPSAAALAYYLSNKEEGLYLVFDFGGGTLDVTVVDIFDGMIDILSIAGNTSLGGIDIDRVIYNAFLEKNPSLSNMDDKNKAILMNKAEKAKIDLDTLDETVMGIIYEDNKYEMQINRQTLIDLCSSINFEIYNVIERALRNCGSTINDIVQVVSIGGSSKGYVILKYLERLVGKPINISINPDEAIVRGIGAVVGIMDREESIKEIILTDVCPFTLGVGIINDQFSPIIERNTTLPASKTSGYTTTRDNQDVIKFDMYQGESMIASENSLIDSIEVKVPSKKKGEAFVDITFSYDINGILHVLATSELENENISKVIYTNKHLSEKDIAVGNERIASIKEQKSDYTKYQQWLIDKANSLYLQIDDEKRTLMLEEMKLFINKLSNNPSRVQQKRVESDFKNTLENIEKDLEDVFKFEKVDTSLFS